MKLWLRRNRIECIFLLFFILRLAFLIQYPPFNDESIYVSYGQAMVKNAPLRWSSIQYFSKQPLAFWMFGLGAKLFSNPFIGARLVVLIINTISFFFLLDWLKRITHEKVMVTSLVLFAVCPLFILFQTLALMEGFLIPALIILLWALDRYWQNSRTRYIVVAAIALSFSLWVKSSAILLTVVTVAMLAYQARKRPKIAILHIAVLIILILVLMSPLFARPDFKRILTGPQEYTYTLNEMFTFPASVWWRNISLMTLGYLLYLTPLYIPALYFSSRYLTRRQFAYLLIWTVSILGTSVLLGKIFAIRYVMLGAVPLLPLIAVGLTYLSKSRVLALTVGLGVPFVCSILLVIYSPWFFALFPAGTILAYERNYGYGYTSGYAGSQAISYIRNQLMSTAPVILAVTDRPGNPTHMVGATFYNDPMIWTIILNSPADLKMYTPGMTKYPTYFIARKDTLLPFLAPYLTTVVTFPTPDNVDYVGIYKINLGVSPLR